MFYARYKKDYSRFGKIIKTFYTNNVKMYEVSIEYKGLICAKSTEFDVLNAVSNIEHFKLLLAVNDGDRVKWS